MFSVSMACCYISTISFINVNALDVLNFFTKCYYMQSALLISKVLISIACVINVWVHYYQMWLQTHQFTAGIQRRTTWCRRTIKQRTHCLCSTVQLFLTLRLPLLVIDQRYTGDLIMNKLKIKRLLLKMTMELRLVANFDAIVIIHIFSKVK